MNNILLASLILAAAQSANADCFDMAGRDYRIDPDLLRAIAWNESHYNISITGKNPSTGYGSGLMQIDSQHFAELSRYGIRPEHLLNDACMNIYTGAYYLAIAFKKWGQNWQAVGAYNAGFKKSEKQAIRRYQYAARIESTYRAIRNRRNSEQAYAAK